MHALSTGNNSGGGGRSRSKNARNQSFAKMVTQGLPSGANASTPWAHKNGKTLDDIIEELVATSGSDRNWKGMLIAILVILIVLGFILLSVVWMTPPKDHSPKGKKMSFSDFLSNNLSGNLFNGTWVSDREILFKDEFNCLVLHDVSTSQSIVIVSNQTFNRLQPEIYSLSSDKKFIYLGYNYIKNFRHSFYAKYIIYEVQTGKEFPIVETPEEEDLMESSGAYTEEEVPYLQYVEWSTVGNAFVFVYGNNMYYKRSAKDTRVYPLSTDGRIGIIFNGIPDWIYEEEVLGSNKALWFSSDGSRLSYVQFNDSQVEEISLPSYDPRDLKSTSIRYPKAGARNPTVRVIVVDIQSLQSYTVPPPRIISQRDHYVVSTTWVDNSILSTSWINRHQNLSIVAHCEEKNSWHCQEVYRESTEKGWSNMISSLHYRNRPPESEFLVLAPVMDGQSGFFRHIMRVSYGNSSIKEPLTIGNYDVTNIYGWDAVNNFIYFGSSPRDEPSHLHVYRISYNSSGPPHTMDLPLCLTCAGVVENIQAETEVDLWLRGYVHDSKVNILPSVSAKSGCLKNSAIFSRDLSYWAWECSGPETPPKVFLVHSANNSVSATLVDNSELRRKIANMSLPLVRSFSLQIPDTPYNASVKLYLPPEVKFESLMTYPLIVQVYAGPETQATQAEWRHGWASYLAGRMGWIIALIDGRGSKGGGEQKKREIWKRLGSVEVQDQITVTKYISKKIPIVDLRRIAIWGWSYGGYAALRALAHPSQDIFQCAISIAPVTSWRFYDSVYTERYMGMPDISGNYLGYDQSDVIYQTSHFRSTEKTMRKLFLIHGTRDDNVHIQHSMVLSKELIKQGIFFKQQIYPDATHNFQNVRHHFYLSMERFFSSCFDEVTKREASPPSLSLGSIFYGKEEPPLQS